MVQNINKLMGNLVPTITIYSYIQYIGQVLLVCCKFLDKLIMRGLVSLYSNHKLLACLAMLANGREEKIVPRLVQRNTGVPFEVGVDSIFGRAASVVLLGYLNHRIQPRIVLENCNAMFGCASSFCK